MYKVHSHGQEYWTLTRLSCRCGASYTRKSVGGQRLVSRPSGDADILCVQCERCGRESELEFDISSFYGKVDARAFQDMLGDEQCLWEMYIWHQLRMESVMKYLSELAASRDSDAIAYIADAARNFLEKAGATTSAGPN